MKKSIVYILLSLLLIFVTSCTSIPSYEITFDSNGGTEVEKQVVFEGGHGVKPIHPTKEGYIFAYWSLDGEEYDFTTMIVSNITLVAVWETLDEHTHRYTSTTVKPTCVDQGYDEYICSCGDTYKENYVDELGHTLKEHPAKEPTTSESGWEKYYTCINCDYTTFKELPTLDSDEIKIYAIDGIKYFNFGKYPQSKVTDENLINILNTIPDTNEKGYTEYKGNEYLITLNKVSNKLEWFKVEPIAWRILEDKKNGTYFVLSRYILDCGYTESHSGSYVYYQDPKMADVINKVKTLSFNSDQLSKITKSIYVISEEEATNSIYGFAEYGVEDIYKSTTCTDYAAAMGSKNTWYITGSTWLNVTRYYYCVNENGKITSFSTSNKYLLGVRPACIINIG